MKKLTIGVCNYNNDVFLGVLLGEIFQQCRCDDLFNLIDVVVYDDCSTSDESKKILNQYKDVFKIVFAEENSGGPARGRNYILEHATSEYIFFVDADDMILGNIKNILEELEVEKDIYVSDLKKISSDGYISGSTMIYSWTLFHGNVKEEDIKKLVANQTGIWSIYNVKFLKENNIRYLENFRYEDNILFFTILMQNPRLGLLKEKYYGWRNNYSGFTHGETMLSARMTMVSYVLDMMQDYQDNIYAPYIYASMWNQTMTNIIRCYPVMSAVEYHTYFDALNDIFNKHDDQIKKYRKVIDYKYTDIYFKLSRFKHLNRFPVLRGVRGLKRTKTAIKRTKFDLLKVFTLLPINQKKIFFMSQYGHYNDNSKYLYLQMKNDPKYKDYKFVFAVKDNYVDLKSNPDFIDYKKWLKHFYHHYTAKEVYFNTWYNPRIYKRKGQVWTQLWHGYPYKKVHTDINTYFSTFNNQQVLNRHLAINKWDYVWSVDSNNTEIFKRIFYDINIIEKQYPKIQYLIDNKDNQELISETKKEYNLKENEKYVLYAPTYRPYKYYLDLLELEKLIPKDHKLIMHVHPMMKHRIINEKAINYMTLKNVEDIQPLVLCMDKLITDCSSIQQDFKVLNKEVIYFFDDKDIYNRIHGIY